MNYCALSLAESNNVSGNSESSSALDKRKKRRKNKPVAKLLPKVGDVYGDKGDQSVSVGSIMSPLTTC